MRLVSLLLGFLLLVAAGGAGVYWYVAQQLTPKPVSPAVLAVEQALATEDTVVLMHFDVAAAVRAERLLLGEEDRQALLDPIAANEPVMGELQRAGVNLRDSLDHVLAAVTVSDQEVAGGMILTGRFPVETIRQAIERNYMTEAGADGLLIVTQQNLESCELSDPMAVSLAADQIVVGTPDFVTKLLSRQSAGAAADLDLAAWRAYRDGRVFALALTAPPMAVADQIDGPAADFAKQAAEDNLDPVERLYFGARIATLPPALVLDARIEASDPAWPQDSAQAYDQWRQNFTGQVAQRLPALARLQDHATVAAEGSALLVETTLGESFIEDLAAGPGEMIRLAFSGLEVETAAAPSGQITEQIMDPGQVTRYQANLAPSDLQPFDPALDQSFTADGESGPFGLRIKALRLVEQDETLVQLELEAASSEIANMELDSMHQGDQAPRAQIFITQVLDRAGANLLRDEPCGAQRNDLGGVLEPRSKSFYRNETFVTVPAVQGTKAVRLVPGTRIADLAAVEGVVELRLPTRVETLRLSAPFAGQVVEQAGVRLKFDQAEPNQVKYEISGQPDRVLAVRALNGAGDYLASAGSFGSGRLLGPGKTIGRDFQGIPATLEVVIATGENVAQYPFHLSPVEPRFNEWDYPKPFTVGTGERTALTGQVSGEDDCPGTTAGDQVAPFRLCLQNLQAYWGNNLGASGYLQAPASDLLAGNLSGLELRIDQITLAGAEAALPTGFSSFLELSSDGDQLRSWFSDTLSLPEGTELTGTGFSQVDGQVILRLPRRLSQMTLDVSELGNQVAGPEGISARLVALADQALELELMIPREKLVQFIPRASDGTALATNAVRLEPGETAGQWHASLRSSGRPATLEIVVAEDQDETVQAFSLTLAN